MTASVSHRGAPTGSERLVVKDLNIPNNDISRLKKYFGMNKADEERLAGLKEVAQKYSEHVIDAFYKHVATEPEASSFLADPKILERARRAQTAYFQQLTAGRYEAEYVESRLEVGTTHNRINLPPKWYIGGFSYYIDTVADELLKALGDSDVVLASFRSFIKIITFDISLVMEAFVIERERELKKQQLVLEQQHDAIKDLVNKLGNITTRIAGTSAELSSATAESVAAISQTTATAEEVKQTAEQTSQKAKSVSDEAKGVVTVSKQGQNATSSTIQGMVRIREQMESIADCMVQLSNQSKLIGDIIATVDDLAQQSNLLAVNASIEAAKAGEQGKGFAVVAQEVKNLSQQSKAATAHVRSILNDIVKATTAATSATEQGSKAVDAGHQQASEAGKVIQTLSESIEKAQQATDIIEISSQQQLVGMQQMVEAMENIKDAGEQNLKSANQMEMAAKELSEIGKSLLGLTSRAE